ADAAADLARASALLLALREEHTDGAALAQPFGRVLMYAGHDAGSRGAWAEAEAEMREGLEWHACAADGDDPAGHLAYALLATRSSMADLLALEGKKAEALALRLAVTADMDDLVERYPRCGPFRRAAGLLEQHVAVDLLQLNRDREACEHADRAT